MNKIKANEIYDLIFEIIKDPKPELNYFNNYSLLVSVMLSAQTTDKRVNEITSILFNKYKTPYEVSNAEYDDLFNIIKPLGLAKNKTNNLIKLSKMIHEEYNDEIPNTLEELTKIPGVGRKTANVVLGLAFNIPSIAVDTHVYRVSYRLGFINKNHDVLDTENILKKYYDKDKWINVHHLFLLFGRYYCKANNMECENCKLKKYCRQHTTK